MKNVYFYVFLLFLSLKSIAQGSDVIFWLDNSASMSDNEYAAMKSNIQYYIEGVLECNPNNRVAVVQYAGNLTGGVANSQIYIESDFTNDASVATNFVRRSTYYGLGDHDFAHEALNLIGFALDGVISSGAKGWQKTLSPLSTNSLVIFLYTDAVRYSLDSSLVNYYHPETSTDAAFERYTEFKNERNTTFMVYKIGVESESYAPAAIASGGGPFIGPVESYPSDPDGAGVSGRYAFGITATDLIIENLCNVRCHRKITLNSPLHDVNGTAQIFHKEAGTIIAQNTIKGIGGYKGGDVIQLKSGFHSVTGSTFRGYIEPCDGEEPPCNPCLRESAENFEYVVWEDLFTLSPNPATDNVTISSEREMVSISVTSLDGVNYFTGNPKATTYELNISNYPKGLYVVNVITADGEMEIKKLIKE